MLSQIKMTFFLSWNTKGKVLLIAGWMGMDGVELQNCNIKYKSMWFLCEEPTKLEVVIHRTFALLMHTEKKHSYLKMVISKLTGFIQKYYLASLNKYNTLIVKLLWNNPHCMKCYINKGDLTWFESCSRKIKFCSVRQNYHMTSEDLKLASNESNSLFFYCDVYPSETASGMRK